MRLFVPVFKVFSSDDAVWWRMLSPSGRGIARNAGVETSVDSAHASIAHVVDSIDLLTATIRRTEAFRWRWVLHFDHEPLVWGDGDQDRPDRCERECRRFTLLAPLADVERSDNPAAVR